MAKAEAPDPLTVVFKLKEPFAPFLGAFDCSTAPIVRKHVYEGTDFRKNPMNDRAIGTGPFKLKEWVRGSHVHLVRHDGYYRTDEPHLDEIIDRVIPDAASRTLALENGTVPLAQRSDVAGRRPPGRPQPRRSRHVAAGGCGGAARLHLGRGGGDRGRIPDSVCAALAARGHPVRPVAHVGGGMCAIGFEEDGTMTGAAGWRAGGRLARSGTSFRPDPRREAPSA